MLCLKLSRVGKKKQPTFRLIVIEKTKDPWGDYLELLGNYNPQTKQGQFRTERIKHWLSRGAQMTAAVNNLLINHKIIEGPKRKIIKISQKRKNKTKAVLEGTKTDEQKKVEEELTAKNSEERLTK